MTKVSNRNETEKERIFAIEPLEDRDAPKRMISGGDLGDGSLQKGGGKPSKV